MVRVYDFTEIRSQPIETQTYDGSIAQSTETQRNRRYLYFEGSALFVWREQSGWTDCSTNSDLLNKAASYAQDHETTRDLDAPTAAELIEKMRQGLEGLHTVQLERAQLQSAIEAKREQERVAYGRLGSLSASIEEAVRHISPGFTPIYHWS